MGDLTLSARVLITGSPRLEFFVSMPFSHTQRHSSEAQGPRGSEPAKLNPTPTPGQSKWILKFFLKVLFIYFEKDRESVSGEGAEREREKIQSNPKLL